MMQVKLQEQTNRSTLRDSIEERIISKCILVPAGSGKQKRGNHNRKKQPQASLHDAVEPDTTDTEDLAEFIDVYQLQFS